MRKLAISSPLVIQCTLIRCLQLKRETKRVKKGNGSNSLKINWLSSRVQAKQNKPWALAFWDSIKSLQKSWQFQDIQESCQFPERKKTKFNQRCKFCDLLFCMKSMVQHMKGAPLDIPLPQGQDSLCYLCRPQKQWIPAVMWEIGSWDATCNKHSTICQKWIVN